MSMTKEHAAQYHDKPAIVCCRTVKGTNISPADLEDPAIFKDLEESGLVTITPETLTIEEVLGAVLKKDVDALTSLTAELLDGVKSKAKAPAAAPAGTGGKVAVAPSTSGIFYFKVDKADGLEISFPLGGGGPAAETASGEVIT